MLTGKVDYKLEFRRLRRLQAMGLDAKIEYADRLIEAGLEMADRPGVAWSGGKDSTVLLHRVLGMQPDVDVIFNNTGVEFAETLRFVKRMAKEWCLNLHVAKPGGGKDFWWCLEKYGYPLLGKSFVRRSGFESERQRRVVESGARVSARCCYWLKEKPSLAVERELGIGTVFVGIMAVESHRRRLNWCRFGDFRWHRERRVWKIHPVSVWLEEDILEYHRRFDLPMCDLYALGHRRNGCWPCGMDIKYRENHLATLRRTHPKLWHFLMVDKGLAQEVLKIKLALDDGEADLFAATWDVEDLIRYRPCFFDRI